MGADAAGDTAGHSTARGGDLPAKANADYSGSSAGAAKRTAARVVCCGCTHAKSEGGGCAVAAAADGKDEEAKARGYEADWRGAAGARGGRCGFETRGARGADRRTGRRV